MKMKYLGVRLCAVLCTIILLCGIIPVGLAAGSYEKISMGDVNVRRRASQSSPVIDKIETGEIITILGTHGQYYKVKTARATGYAMKYYIDGLAPVADMELDLEGLNKAPSAIYAYPYDTTVLAPVKLRKTPEVTGEVYYTMAEGDMVTVLERLDCGFVRVRHGKQTGYAAETHINIADLPASSPVSVIAPDEVDEKYSVLSYGSRGEEVWALQSALCELGYLKETAVDGTFGTATEKALMTFQKRNGFKQDGIASSALQTRIYEGTPKDVKGYRQYVKTLAPVEGAVIRTGSIGSAVNTIQMRLSALGYYEGDLTGKCDEDTVAAILLFEGRNGLTADGTLNAEDQKVLFSETVYGADDELPIPPQPPIPAPERVLKQDSTGEDVGNLQRRLAELGYYDGPVTELYDQATADAVKAFQKKNSITADGVCGPVTATVLFGEYVLYAIPTSAPMDGGMIAANTEITRENVVNVRLYSMGSEVLRIQQRLQELGYYTSRLDGTALEDDIDALKAYQKDHGLKADGVAGYETQSLMFNTSALPGELVAENTGATEDPDLLSYGMAGETVQNLQQQLINLGYLTGTADGKFGVATRKALIRFQKANGLRADGIAGTETFAKLSSTTAIAGGSVLAETLKVGAESEAVRVLQNQLIALGYMKGKADGKFGASTTIALMAFQKAFGLSQDGIAGGVTQAALSRAIAAEEARKTPPTASGVSASQVQYKNWYTDVKSVCKKYPNATIYDFTTGISWQVNIFSLGAHADCEPLTKQDTDQMNRAFGGKTTWTPKAVWVVFSDGSVYMGSTHNTPHGTWHIRTNGFNGHMCIHFPRTQAQVEKIGPYATSHQKAIDQGWEATLRRVK